MTFLHGPIEEKYEILGRLRQGGMGAVYKARHRLLEEHRAIKVLRSYAAGGEVQARFLQEARVASRLRHPNLAVLHDFAVDEEGDAYLVSEFIDGWTLRELLRRLGPPPLSLGLEVARQSLRALGYLHRHRIVHRDISPDNLMLTRDAEGLPLVKLIDLGIAKALEDEVGATTSGFFMGKPRYASPEQFGAEPADERSDIYSLGVVLYELFTGRCPIAGHDALSLMSSHLNQPPLDFAESDPEGNIPADLREILLGALEKRPEDRIPNVEEFGTAVEAVQSRYPLYLQDLEPLLGLSVGPPAPASEATDETTAEASDTLYLRSSEPQTTRSTFLPLVAAPSAAAEPSRVDEVTWGSRSPGLQYEPLAPEPEPERAESSSTLFRLALSAAALLVLFVLARGFWLPGPETRKAPREPVAARRPPTRPVVAERRAEEPVAVAEPQAEPTLVEELEGSPPEPAAAPAEESPAPEPAAVAAVAPPPVREEEKEPEPAQPVIAQRAAEPAPERPAPAVQARPLRQPWEEGSQPSGLLKPGPDVEEPVPLEFPRYSYPAAARGTGLKADVRLALLVDERGRVIAARVREGAPADLGFTETALAVAQRIPFQPATRYRRPGKMWTEVILEFVE